MIKKLIAYKDLNGIEFNGVFASFEDRTICSGSLYLRS